MFYYNVIYKFGEIEQYSEILKSNNPFPEEKKDQRNIVLETLKKEIKERFDIGNLFKVHKLTDFKLQYNESVVRHMKELEDYAREIFNQN